ncbi:MAG: FlgD immunoglobulin-like domain containing protein, partial [bacterium]
DLFLAQFDNALTKIEKATYLGGSGDEIDCAFALDRNGNIYVSAMTASLDFPVTPGAFDETYNGGAYDGYLAKISPDLDELVFSTYYGGNASDEPEAIDVHPSGEAYLAGLTHSDDFPSTEGPVTIHDDYGEAFVMRFNNKGDVLKYSYVFGGDSEDLPGSIVLSPGTNAKPGKNGNGNEDNRVVTLNLAGLTKSSDFPTTPDAYDSTLANIDGWNDIIFMRFVFGKDDKKGNALLASKDDMVLPENQVGINGRTSVGHEGEMFAMDIPEKVKVLKKQYYEAYQRTDKDDWKSGESGQGVLNANALLGQNYPNPFTAETRIEVHLPADAWVSLKIFTLDGKEVCTLVQRELEEGKHSFTWNATDQGGQAMPGGIYLLRLDAGDRHEVNRMLYLP